MGENSDTKSCGVGVQDLFANLLMLAEVAETHGAWAKKTDQPTVDEPAEQPLDLRVLLNQPQPGNNTHSDDDQPDKQPGHDDQQPDEPGDSVLNNAADIILDLAQDTVEVFLAHLAS